MAMAFGAEGPEARAVLTYSQSGDPASPHFTDQTVLYGEERMRPILFSAGDIAADPALETLTLTLD
jgi:acyl-homoserine-lactone acylase